MYVRPSHQPRDHADTLEAIRRNMFATLVTCSPAGMIASHLPFMLDEQRGEQGTLLAHMARANPQSALLAEAGEALVIFLGPHGYISPSWYIDRATAPTWDYVAVHCYGTIRVHSGEEARQNIERLVTLMERERPNPWSLADLSEQSVSTLLQNVVSFQIALTRVEGKFKLNQGEKPERTRSAAAELEREGAGELAEYIRRYNDLG